MRYPQCGTENRQGATFCMQCGAPLTRRCPNCETELRPTARFFDKWGQVNAEQPQAPPITKPKSTDPTSFAGGRYQVKKLFGEVGKKKVYLSHNNVLNREVAFALIKTGNLDEEATGSLISISVLSGRSSIWAQH